MFESALHTDAFQSPSLPSGFHFRQPSPSSASSVNGSHLEPPLSYDALSAQNTVLKTRVSELEVINNLYHERVNELENNEKEIRRQEVATHDTENQLRAELAASRQREVDLKRRIDELEEEAPRHKKMRMSDLVDESRTATPGSSMEQ
jgi:GATA-binding protein